MQLYPQTNPITLGSPVYKPEPYTDLLGEDDTNALIKKFAGGILGGFQVQQPNNARTYGQTLMAGVSPEAAKAVGIPGQAGAGVPIPARLQEQNGPMITPIDPSGVYDTTPNGTAPISDDGQNQRSGKFNAMHLMALQDAIGRGNWGNSQRPSLANVFEAGSDGSFSLKDGGFDGIDWKVPNGMQGMASWADAGMTPDQAVQYWARQLGGVDESA